MAESRYRACILTGKPPHPAFHCVAARYQQAQVLWLVFAAFWPTNAILLAALFRSAGQTLPPKMGAITAPCGVFVSIVWFLIQRRALGHVKKIEAIAEAIEKVLLAPAVILSKNAYERDPFLKFVGCSLGTVKESEMSFLLCWRWVQSNQRPHLCSDF
jgi:hypothetical protein